MYLIINKLKYEYEKLIIKSNNLHKKFIKQPTVASMSETINVIKEKRASISRYGDGEFDLIFGRTQGFQKQNKALASNLKYILKCNHISDRFLIGIPDCFGELSQFIPEAQYHWKIRLDKERYRWVSCLNTKYPYYNSQITRFYFDWADKSKCQKWFDELKSIWDNENVIMVEGDKSRVGVGNDMFDNAKTVRRIICPSENAFDKYDEILKTIISVANETDLIMIALGPTASVLAFDLFKLGFWAFDCGHIDIEYEWMKHNVKEKTAIHGKYVNEVDNGNIVYDIDDKQYFNEIISTVK